jgi:hypothetical protein
VPADNKTVRNFLVTRTINRTLRTLKLRYPRAAREVLKLAKHLR